ncbi:MAG: VWA domain-containing protein [Alphaproteobacteria bacterium]|nr:VWA domain-containing protein [Alphaproteobacteria bacterium]
MSEKTLPPVEPGFKLGPNIMYFARALRAAGVPVGPGKVLDAIAAVEAVGVMRRDDFYAALRATLCERREHFEVFDQAFKLFWRDPRVVERLLSLLFSKGRQVPLEGGSSSRRVTDALSTPASREEREEPKFEIEFDAALTYSRDEVLQTRDFESMSAEELAQAKAAIRLLKLPIQEVPTRRFRPDSHGARIDMRATLRGALRAGSEVMDLKRKRRATRRPPLVVLCDVSGSMSRYSRMLLHFVHALTNDRDRVHVFLFGTRLTNISRQLEHRDPDVAVERSSASVNDWSGGTRIGRCLAEFNRDWSRRVLGQGALVILITDGLDRDAVDTLGHEIERLHRSCRRLIWLNPLLRYDQFKPEAAGIKTILPHVDEFRPVHNLKSLADIARALSEPLPRRLEPGKRAA